MTLPPLLPRLLCEILSWNQNGQINTFQLKCGGERIWSVLFWLFLMIFVSRRAGLVLGGGIHYKKNDYSYNTSTNDSAATFTKTVCYVIYCPKSKWAYQNGQRFWLMLMIFGFKKSRVSFEGWNKLEKTCL